MHPEMRGLIVSPFAHGPDHRSKDGFVCAGGLCFWECVFATTCRMLAYLGCVCVCLELLSVLAKKQRDDLYCSWVGDPCDSKKAISAMCFMKPEVPSFFARHTKERRQTERHSGEKQTSVQIGQCHWRDT